MKNIIVISAVLLIGFTSCTKKNSLVLTNPLAVDRPDETIILKRADVEAKVGLVPEGFAPVLKLNGQNVPSQADDLDADGNWDELAFTIDFKASETITLDLQNVDVAQYPEFEKRTNVRLGIEQPDHSYLEVDEYMAPSCKDSFKIIAQGESVSWENDKMGFRNYFDCRNVKDLFGKLKPGLIIDKIHTPEISDYHVLSDWGMDILHCGSSTGSGGLAMLEADSLYRLGSTDTYEYRKITEGPVRSVFDLIYTGWNVAGENLSAIERISIYPGKYWFQSDVTVSGFSGEKQLVTGIVTSLLKNEPIDFEANSDYRSIATHDLQSLNNDELGMAVMLKKDEVTKVARTTDIDFYKLGYKTVDEKQFSNVISQTYYVAQKINADAPARHYFFAVWGLENAKWKNADNFMAYISSEADFFSHPIVIKE
ncbi:MAG TPA: DUF4861 domain-containing protein [Prolixibacteraceae bacterium]|nr:DUF4861 domain-containing protein [Prolixibacteraceae bacterium]